MVRIVLSLFGVFPYKTKYQQQQSVYSSLQLYTVNSSCLLYVRYFYNVPLKDDQECESVQAMLYRTENHLIPN